MANPSKRRVIVNIHVYHWKQYYVVPVVRESSGLWVEVQPALTVPEEDADALAQAISASHQVAQSGAVGSNWDGQGGQVWAVAQHFWSIRWHDDATVTVIPYHPVDTSASAKSDLEAGQNTWTAIQESSKNISAPTYGMIAKIILEMARSAI